MGRRIIIQPRQKIIEINELQLFTDKKFILKQTIGGQESGLNRQVNQNILIY